jgi:ribosomal protein S18 acetylase RimI-like enzyme
VKDTTPEVVIRPADVNDVPDIARIHMESWRRHYRGMYSDAYLDGDLYADRLTAWTGKLAWDHRTHFTVLAEHDGRTVGFAHVALDGHEKWGALVDNLHVSHTVQRGGIGTLLLDHVARMVAEQRPGSGIYLWVLEQNTQAIAFYEARKGVLRDSEPSAPPGGDPRHLHGSPRRIRVTWGDPTVLLLRD